ncbi:MAG: restriction endonuclease subunit S [Sulfurimonas sp.]|uniref:restriction endonuclease subunit S n=1 Tax=Sulfurimonas sp. TaxID=2022749 RepID=UPI0025F27718|nr:restriction endonuclease subunit S [Sulfurimonas sp.]MCK9492322.1 restriction endonuclease subunit S [Sulfurimonas sp.]
MSGVVVPEGWEIKQVSSLCKILDNLRIPLNDEERQNMKGHIPYYGANTIVDYINDHIFDEDLILLAEDGGNFDEYEKKPIAFKISGKSWINNHAHVLKPNNNVEFDYLFYSFEHKNITSYIRGGTRSKLNQSDLKTVEVLIPKEKKEQEKIAKILSTLDKNIENTNKIIEKEKNIKKALMQELLTNGIDQEDKIRSPKTHTYKQSKLGLIPEEWEVVSLGEIGNFKNGVNKSKDDFGFGIPFVNLQDVFGHWEIKHSDFDLVNATKEELKNYSLKKGDVLFIRSSVKPSGVGLTALVKEDMLNTIYSGFIIRFRSKEKIFNNDYKKYYFHDELFRQRLLQKSTVSANSNINQESLFSLRLLLPQITEQKQIAKILNTQDKKIESEQKNLSKLQELKKGLMSDLLSGKVRVNA